MKLTILGCNSGVPRENSQTTSQIIEIGNSLFLIDCGEGTQNQIRKQKIKFSRIKQVFISHLHGDHFFGLIGLISSFRLLGRTSNLDIYGPKGIKEIITLQLKYSQSWTNYQITFHELSSLESELIYENDFIRVFTIPLKHRIYTNGFLFKEKKGLRKINIDMVNKYNISTSDFENLKKGKDLILDDENIINNELITLPPSKPMSYAFCSDTSYHEDLVDIITGVDVLYHESTFLNIHQELAKLTKHSTASDAAKIAKKSKIKNLILGHFSARYRDKKDFLNEARVHFENVELAEDGKIFIF
ncbi:MAG: ribonuclease Z [Flavobacteriaceae bacterium]|nr:ribonuclease Z [Flavobacteriaceae bacterium]